MSSVRYTVHTAFVQLLLLALFLLAGAAAYRAYFAAPDIPETYAHAPTRPALAEQAVIFVIDGFHPGHAFDPAVMPTLTRLASGGASGIARTSSMSLTAPCIFSLATGRPGTLLQALLDLHPPETRVESLPRLMHEAGRRVVISGDPSWPEEFGWTARAEDVRPTQEAGLTMDAAIREADAESVAFLVRRLPEGNVGLAVTHLASADVAGHLVTPTGAMYVEALSFLDGLLARVVLALGPRAILLVTGDHGMGPRGTHTGGRDDEATRTPFVLYGAGIRAGATADVAQTAFAPTLAAAVGLPLPQASEHPPLVELLALDPAAKEALLAEYLAGKTATARALTPGLDLGGGDFATIDAKLNAVLFATGDARVAARLLAAAAVLLAVGAALVLGWRSIPWPSQRSSLAGYLALTLAVPASLAAAASTFVAWRSWFPYRSTPTAAVLAVVLFAALAFVGLAAHRSPRLRHQLKHRPAAAFFIAMVLLSAPLVNSVWLPPRPLYEGLLIVLWMVYVVTRRLPWTRAVPLLVVLPVFVAVAGYDGIPALGTWTSLLPLSVATLLSALYGAWGGEREPWREVDGALLVAAFGATCLWRVWGGPAAARLALVLGLATIAAATVRRRPPGATAALVIGAAAALALLLVESGREAAVFLMAALAALALAQHRIPLSEPKVLYVAAALALLTRIFLYFELGDSYSINSIRTGSGFRVVESGLPLGTVTAILLLKYTLPWLLILGAGLPSLAAAGPRVACHAVDLLALGYVARFAIVGALVDAFRVLPNGMDGLVSVFGISCGELVTLTAAGSFAVLLVARICSASEHCGPRRGLS